MFSLYLRALIVFLAAEVITTCTLAVMLAQQPLRPDSFLDATKAMAGITIATMLVVFVLVVLDWVGILKSE